MNTFNNLSLMALFVLSLVFSPNNKTKAQESDQRTIITAVPFLGIIPDARSSAMGDVGIAITPDANSLFFNASNMVFASKTFGLSVTYTSWLKSLGLDDIFLAYVSGYKKIGDDQMIAGGLRYFSLGKLSYTDEMGNALQSVKPYELAADIAYARKLGKHLSLGLTLKYILSNLGSGSSVGGSVVKPAHAFATDLSLTYEKELKIAKKKAQIRAGLVFKNIGTKVSYTDNGEQEFLPANLGLGTCIKVHLDDKNALALAIDLNKLMVPTPVSAYLTDQQGNVALNPNYDLDADGIADYKQQSMVSSLFSSFADAPGGVHEELNEIMISSGLEYWYNEMFALRCGYYYEHQNKGNRQFFSMGIGVRYKIFNFNFSYILPASKAQTNPLDNTLRFSMIFEM